MKEINEKEEKIKNIDENIETVTIEEILLVSKKLMKKNKEAYEVLAK